MPDTYYHGTRRTFAPGDLILARSKQVAHATPNLTTAKVFGEDGRVYEVEPLDPTDVFTRRMKYTQGEVHYETLSETGFRVIRQVWQDDGQDRLTIDDAEDGFLRECDECGRITDAGEAPDWPNGVCERCDPSILNEGA